MRRQRHGSSVASLGLDAGKVVHPGDRQRAATTVDDKYPDPVVLKDRNGLRTTHH